MARKKVEGAVPRRRTSRTPAQREAARERRARKKEEAGVTTGAATLIGNFAWDAPALVKKLERAQLDLYHPKRAIIVLKHKAWGKLERICELLEELPKIRKREATHGDVHDLASVDIRLDEVITHLEALTRRKL